MKLVSEQIRKLRVGPSLVEVGGRRNGKVTTVVRPSLVAVCGRISGKVTSEAIPN